MHLFYIDFQKGTLHIFIPLEIYEYMKVFLTRYQKQGFSRQQFLNHVNCLNLTEIEILV